ncbi:hypothetical protein CASFOL_023833 [Castilleja foliolosa]|uniref:Exocyst subunit Exo70 family protein n=1 Tax=Castilleja foliolosa TaxID=1961234 RepID=A0ABD3CNP2_9LAMI
MDITEKDKTVLHEESSTTAVVVDNSKDVVSGKDDDDDQKNPNGEKNNKNDQDPPQDNEINVSSTKQPSDLDSKPDDAPSSEINDDEKPDHEMNPEQPSPRHPPDLNKVSEDIDQYISSLLNSKEGDDKATLPDVPIFVEQFMVLFEDKIEEYDSSDNPVKWTRLTEEDSFSFLQAVNRVSSLSKALARFSSVYKYACSINHIESVLQRAMSYLEEEFKSLLEDYKIHDSSNSSKTKHSDPSNANEEPTRDPNSEPTPMDENDNILSDMIRLSKVMIAGGYEIECCHVYFVARRNALDESLHKVGFEKHSIDDVHKMSWEVLEREIESWTRIFKQFTTAHFIDERKLSDTVFSDHPKISENLFGTLSHGVVIQLLNFAQAVVLTKRAAEKLFKFIDVYEVVRDVTTIEDMFPEEMAARIKNEASMIRCRLGEAMILIFAELEHSIKADSVKSQVPGGAVHPLTKYTMNYLEYACEYKNTLEQVFKEHQKIERADSSTGSEYQHNESSSKQLSPFTAQITKVLDLLDSNIEGKAKLYKDPALSSIFMMNNGRYMLKKIKGNELNGLIGDTWYRKKSSDIRQYHKGYQRETWGKLLHCLHPEGLTVNGKVMKPALKERFKSFNAMFDEIHKTQSNWVVGDEQLQSELRVSISNMVIPAYRSFLGRYSQTFTPGRQTEKYVKFQGEDIETYIDELFDGTATPMGRKKP